ncbi:unnamed protein product [Phyllotreta striolata]|uniref:Ankyrin repeat domain-containing protein 40 n=1 Tax=Phyllotreta striolata TaxID=444603 RepID=A0A9N9TUV2_PHYSR|nr:unnamed protein product [Phyllotreta striolata]
MASILEEKLREASSLGDSEVISQLLAQNVDVNSQNPVNGWTALHWAHKRGNDHVIKLLTEHGGNPEIRNFKGQTASELRYNSSDTVREDLNELGVKFIPNYLRNPALTIDFDVNNRVKNKSSDFASMPITPLPASQSDDLVLRVRIQGSSDPDFIEIEMPRWKLNYSGLLTTCCSELEILESQVERIRKLPNTRLRKDSDVRRLRDYQALEIVLRSPSNGDKSANSYQSISTKNQTILY